MANVFKRSGGLYLESVNTPEYDESEWLINPSLANVADNPVKYWKTVGDEVFLMSLDERNAVDSLIPVHRDFAKSVSVPANKNISLPFIVGGFQDLFASRIFVDIQLQADNTQVSLFYTGVDLTAGEITRLTNLVKISTGKGGIIWDDNALFETKDTVGMHDFSNIAEWSSPTDSSWIVQPTTSTSPHYGKKVIVTSMQMDLAEDFTIHPGGGIVVELYSNLIPTPLAVVNYVDLKDIISRATSKTFVQCKGGVGPAMQYSYVFTMPPTLWPTVGFDSKGVPKFNKMLVKIKDHQPYRTKTSGELCSIAKGRYFCEIYTDLDFVTP